MNAIQQFYELIAARFCEIEAAKLERAEILVNLLAAKMSGKISEQEYQEIMASLDAARAGEGTER
jgi:hypothetical protein